MMYIILSIYLINVNIFYFCRTEPKRKPLSKLVFSLMKDVVLKKKAKEFGLSSQGDRKILEARLQRYIVLYNAECDKPNPRPVSELIKQCEDEENTERKANKISFLNVNILLYFFIIFVQ